jgi:DNA-binding IscR family transcriptional regulator
VAPVECTADDYLPGSCGREPTCLSRGIWERVQAAILGVLDSTSLDDLLITEALQHTPSSCRWSPSTLLEVNLPTHDA